MAQQVAHPRNPPRAMITSIPRERGQTRSQAGTLEYKDPMDNTWKPAVHLETLRPRLIQEAPPSLYTHAKEKGYDAADVTTFLGKDQPYGSDRDNRDPLLFQIFSTGLCGVKPIGYLTDAGLTVLDPFDHGIRDFPSVLPKCLSTNLGGYDITNYFRQNQYITLYDLIARMPNGYHEQNSVGDVIWHEGPPRYGTVGMRATRFRLHAGLLSWKRRTGSDAKNAKILSLIPANCKDPRVNSTASHRDFTEAEQAEVRRVLVGTAPGRRRIANRNIWRTNRRGNDENEEDSEATIDAINEADENVSRKGLPIGHDWIAKRIHEGGNGNGVTGQVSEAEDIQSIPGYSTKDKKAKHGRERVTPSIPADISSPQPNVDNNLKDVALHVAGPSATPIPVNGRSDKSVQDGISEPFDSAYDSNKPLAKRQRATRLTHLANPNNSHDLDGPTQVDDHTEQTDYRYIDPRTNEDKRAIQQALELTREDFRKKTRMNVPPRLATKFRDESYVSQRLRLQDMLSRVWVGSGAPPQLYKLPAWYGGFMKWRIPDEEGMDLYSSVVE